MHLILELAVNSPNGVTVVLNHWFLLWEIRVKIPLPPYFMSWGNRITLALNALKF